MEDTADLDCTDTMSIDSEEYYSLHTLLTEFDALGQKPDPRKEW